MKTRMINTSIWRDPKFRRCSWLEKYIFQHFLLRGEIQTSGVIIITTESIEALINGTDVNETTPEFPQIKRRHIDATLKKLSSRRMIRYENGGELTVWIRNFLKYQDWGPTVVKSWPYQLEEITSRRLKKLVQVSCRDYCRSKKYKIPKGL